MVAGGFDAAKVPEINYGLLNTTISKHFALYTFHNCDKILAVSHFSKEELLINVGALHDKIEVIYNALSSASFEYGSFKKDAVLTVCSTNRLTWKRKGIDTVVNVAGIMPDIDFIIVGKPDWDFINDNGLDRFDNVTFAGSVSDGKLKSLYQSSGVYLQLSYYESFGCALAESMLSGCVPIVTINAALPEVVGNCGYYVPYGDVEKTRAAIISALENTKLGLAARERIETCFPLSRRKEGLVKVINSLLNKNDS